LILDGGVSESSVGSMMIDPPLSALMATMQPPMPTQELTNANLQRQVDAFLQSLMDIDRSARKIQTTVPKTAIDLASSGHNPSLLSGYLLEDARSKNDDVRGKLFATKLLHDQLALRMDLWDEQLSKEAEAGDVAAKAMLEYKLDTGKKEAES